MGGKEIEGELAREVGAVIIRPGDVLVIGLSREAISHQQAHEYHAKVLEQLPGIRNVVVLPGVSALATYRPDDLGEVER